MKTKLGVFMIFVGIFFAAYYFTVCGIVINCEYPFVWRQSDRYMPEHETCRNLFILGYSMKEVVEATGNFEQFDSVEKSVFIVKTKGADPSPLEVDYWGKRLKIKLEKNDEGNCITIYSDTMSLKNKSYGGGVFFAKISILRDQSVNLTYTAVSDCGKILVKRHPPVQDR